MVTPTSLPSTLILQPLISPMSDAWPQHQPPLPSFLSMAPLFGAGAPEAWLSQGQPSSLELRRGQTDKGAMKGDQRASRRRMGEQGQKEKKKKS